MMYGSAVFKPGQRVETHKHYTMFNFFHSIIEHADYSVQCVGFITTFLRGVEWAATGEVTQEIPENF
ncbi:hypothetical protein [Maribacter sp.]|uniref:hypothetical protein n=1 Tax=Maribacter sp. TaxID=1897614 RepID=UPI0025C4916A|nr:hypothetical protein [Maribacter sp.]